MKITPMNVTRADLERIVVLLDMVEANAQEEADVQDAARLANLLRCLLVS